MNPVGTSPQSTNPHGSSFHTLGPVSRVAPGLSAVQRCHITPRTRHRDKGTASETSVTNPLENDSKQSVQCQLRPASKCEERQRCHRFAGEHRCPFPTANTIANTELQASEFGTDHQFRRPAKRAVQGSIDVTSNDRGVATARG